jgi:hypothetical protein
MSEKTKTKFKQPKGFTVQSTNAVGYWLDDGESDIRFVPRGVRLMDGSAKTDRNKPSILIVGELKSQVTLATKDDEIQGEPGDVVGVFYKPGMGQDLVMAFGIETWIAPAFDEDGERKEVPTGKANKMKLYEVAFASKLGRRIPVLGDTRDKSRFVKTIFDDPSLKVVRRRLEPVEEPETEDVDDDNVPF